MKAIQSLKTIYILLEVYKVSVKDSQALQSEIEGIAEVLVSILSNKESIYSLDLMYYAQIVGDLKQELRIAQARERATTD